MTNVLTADQVADLMQIHEICKAMGADAVVIGATAILLRLRELGRLTRDIDLTVALDLDGFRILSASLQSTAGWRRLPKQEHRWITPAQTIIDLVPPGPGLRSAGKLIWPESEFEMSLAGFDQAFRNSAPVQLGDAASIRVASLPVVTLLKIAAYMDSPYRRAKDLQDIRLLLDRYEQGSECAGINRHVVGDERALRKRSSDSISTSSLALCVARRKAKRRQRHRWAGLLSPDN